MPDLGICADAKLTLQALLDEVKRRKIKPQPSKIDIAQIRTKMERKTDYDNVPIKPQRVFKELNEFFGPETVFVTCIGLNEICAPAREEAALAGARAEVSIVSTTLERMRIRAPLDATILELNAKIGETAGAGGETPLAVLGDTTHLQIRAEVEERDVHKIYPGQGAIVKSEAFPGRTFDARVSVVAKALGSRQLTARGGQRKGTDVDVLEVTLDLDDGTPLLTGMRADVLFKDENAAPKNSAARTE